MRPPTFPPRAAQVAYARWRAKRVTPDERVTTPPRGPLSLRPPGRPRTEGGSNTYTYLKI